MKYIITQIEFSNDEMFETVFCIVEADSPEEIQTTMHTLGKRYDDARENMNLSYRRYGRIHTASLYAEREFNDMKSRTVIFYAKEFCIKCFSKHKVYKITPLDEFIQKHTL